MHPSSHAPALVSRSVLKPARSRASLGRFTSGFGMHPRAFHARDELHAKTRRQSSILSANAIRIAI